MIPQYFDVETHATGQSNQTTANSSIPPQDKCLNGSAMLMYSTPVVRSSTGGQLYSASVVQSNGGDQLYSPRVVQSNVGVQLYSAPVVRSSTGGQLYSAPVVRSSNVGGERISAIIPMKASATTMNPTNLSIRCAAVP